MGFSSYTVLFHEGWRHISLLNTQRIDITPSPHCSSSPRLRVVVLAYRLGDQAVAAQAVLGFDAQLLKRVGVQPHMAHAVGGRASGGSLALAAPPARLRAAICWAAATPARAMWAVLG